MERGTGQKQELANSLHALTSLTEDECDCCPAEPPIAKEHDDYIAKQEDEKSSIGTAIAMAGGAMLGAFLTSISEPKLGVRVADVEAISEGLEDAIKPAAEMMAV